MTSVIETRYNGYRFRSRLEARWAVFFDAAHIEYRYEPEGYGLSDGRAYLPDFFLPEFNIFVEIKPDRMHDDGKALVFSRDNCGFDGYGGVLVCYGDPYLMDLRFVTHSEHEGAYDTETTQAGAAFLVDEANRLPFLYIEDGGEEMAFVKAFRIYTDCQRPPRFTPFPIRVAAVKARQARFEHGENGGIDREN